MHAHAHTPSWLEEATARAKSACSDVMMTSASSSLFVRSATVSRSTSRDACTQSIRAVDIASRRFVGPYDTHSQCGIRTIVRARTHAHTQTNYSGEFSRALYRSPAPCPPPLPPPRACAPPPQPACWTRSCAPHPAQSACPPRVRVRRPALPRPAHAPAAPRPAQRSLRTLHPPARAGAPTPARTAVRKGHEQAAPRRGMQVKNDGRGQVQMNNSEAWVASTYIHAHGHHCRGTHAQQTGTLCSPHVPGPRARAKGGEHQCESYVGTMRDGCGAWGAGKCAAGQGWRAGYEGDASPSSPSSLASRSSAARTRGPRDDKTKRTGSVPERRQRRILGRSHDRHAIDLQDLVAGSQASLGGPALQSSACVVTCSVRWGSKQAAMPRAMDVSGCVSAFASIYVR